MRAGGGGRTLAALAALSAGASCSSDFCAQLQALDWSQTVGGCSDAGALPAPATCEAQLGPCNSTDRTGLNGYVSCLQNLPACQTAQQAQWDQAFLRCGSLLQQLSSSCPFELPGGRSIVVGTPPPGDGGCLQNDDCAAISCPCLDVDGGIDPLQLCVGGSCATVCPNEAICCNSPQLPSGSVCAGPCTCGSSVCNAGICE